MLGSIKRRLPSPSMAVALIALFVALGGTATAASVLIRSSKQIKNGIVTGSDLKDGTVTRKDIKAGTVGLDQLQPSAKTAIENAGTQALEAFRIDGPQNVAAGAQSKVATLGSIPAGVYAVFAKTVLTPKQAKSGLLQQGATMSGHCTLDVQGDQDQSRALLGGPGSSSPGQVDLQITRTFSGTGEAVLTCDVEDASWSATNTSIIAVRVGAAPRQAVDG